LLLFPALQGDSRGGIFPGLRGCQDWQQRRAADLVGCRDRGQRHRHGLTLVGLLGRAGAAAGDTYDTPKKSRNLEALDAMDRVTGNTHGGDRKSEERKIKHDNITLEKEQGTSRSYALRKLRRDAPEVHARVLSGELSPHGN